ncbi:MAG: folate-binding protein YgfZ [Gammaproteobacteria bacterium]|nr:folate-binding protein YgfZ [Gammaproteobacteria bacterium]
MTIETLPQFALLKISGADAGSFLQGQLTNDVFQLGSVMDSIPGEEAIKDSASRKTPGWQLSAYCNPKGRTLALFYLWKQGDDFFALLDRDLVKPISDRLRMFVLRSQVTIEMLSEASICGGASSDAVADLKLPELRLNQVQHGDLLISAGVSILIVNARVLVVDPQGHEPAISDSNQKGTRWMSADIEEGIPHLGAGTSELFIPQMLNLDLLNGISFNKGCYTGQEIVARMHYLGNLKQRMFRTTIQSINEPKTEIIYQSADKVFADPELSKPVGHLVNVQGDRALAVLRLHSIENPLYLQAGTSLQVDISQPYPLEHISGG